MRRCVRAGGPAPLHCTGLALTLGAIHFFLRGKAVDVTGGESRCGNM